MKKVGKIMLVAFVVIIVTIFLVSMISSAVFNYKVGKEIDVFLEKQKEVEVATIPMEKLGHLPDPVQKWLVTSGILDREMAYFARSKQTAFVRLDQNQENWMPLEADQYFTVKEPGFLWKAKFKIAPFLHIAGRDLYDNGTGHMLIKFQSFFTVADATGYEIDQGTLIRYLAEIVWVPSAALQDYITWEAIDETSVKATMSFQNISASGVFTFDEEGNPIHFIADRYGEFDGNFIKKPWSIEMYDHQFIDGYKVPTKAKITWKLDNGDYTWYVLELEDLEYNKLEKY
ncbi:hypothetical protein BKP37_08975 [Anaerobacillus alkalilacustris]|uniref:Uncharacterized protein n=1 Tax=Anaerobacillus alkalilacustris TaxID=393763 RepID=A0A1S2LPA6_9BACI|nr:DUF6544 family protein [Anaerobacillus alkalilacustris]OIJ14206.1 hypothetical protein BKP37_08975 [Anaerobacillus alkalilacustris]